MLPQHRLEVGLDIGLGCHNNQWAMSGGLLDVGTPKGTLGPTGCGHSKWHTEPYTKLCVATVAYQLIISADLVMYLKLAPGFC